MCSAVDFNIPTSWGVSKLQGHPTSSHFSEKDPEAERESDVSTSFS